MKIDSLAVIMTCFNRCEKTVTCLRLLKEQINVKIAKLDVYLVDDGSTDNTSEEVSKNFPDVKIIKGNGSLFWNRGMHLAFENSIKGEYEFYLWLNDDTHLYPNALEVVFSAYNKLPQNELDSIIVGPTYDPDTQTTSYGGYKVNSIWNPFKYAVVEPGGRDLEECDTMCGNFVLIPKGTVEKVGIIDPLYKHRYGDVDYGNRARRAGIKIYSAPEHIGECDFNNQSNSWENRELPLKERIRLINSIKGLEKEDWKRYTREYGGRLWYMYWLSPYLKIYLTSFPKRIKSN
jgi:GT2 family glycosyltransferase